MVQSDGTETDWLKEDSAELTRRLQDREASAHTQSHLHFMLYITFDIAFCMMGCDEIYAMHAYFHY